MITFFIISFLVTLPFITYGFWKLDNQISIWEICVSIFIAAVPVANLIIIAMLLFVMTTETSSTNWLTKQRFKSLK